MIPCYSSLPNSVLLNVTESVSKIVTACTLSEVAELQDSDPEYAVVIQMVFHCALSLHMMYSGSIYLYNDDMDQSYFGNVSGLSLSKIYLVCASVPPINMSIFVSSSHRYVHNC